MTDTATHDLAATLPILHRLALAYAPARARPAALCLLALDARMARTVREASDPLLAQIGLAWWRETISQPLTARPRGEPLVEALDCWGGQAADLLPLIDGWEHLAVAEAIDEVTAARFASGRAEAFGALARLLDHPEHEARAERMAHAWAMADLASHLDQAGEAGLARSMLAGETWSDNRIGRDLRPLAVLHAVAARCMHRGETMRTLSRMTMLVAMRTGLFGR